MRHGRRVSRLSRRSEHRQATLDAMAQAIVKHGRIRTTLVKGREAKRSIDRLVTLGKDGSIASRRRAFVVLQDRDLVKRLFAEIAPRFIDVQGGYTRLLRLPAPRRGDGAQLALLELTRLPVETEPTTPAKGKGKEPAPAESKEPAEAGAEVGAESADKPKRFFDSLRDRFRKKDGHE
jgi:large subunit ribosomal protein L17